MHLELCNPSQTILRKFLGEHLSTLDLEKLVFDKFDKADTQIKRDNKDRMILSLLTYARQHQLFADILLWLHEDEANRLLLNRELLPHLLPGEREAWLSHVQDPLPVADSPRPGMTLPQQDQTIAIPVAVLAMTTAEADEVERAIGDDQYAYNQGYKREGLQALGAIFSDGERAELLQRYDATERDKWQPYIAQNPTEIRHSRRAIRAEIIHVVNHYNSRPGQDVGISLTWQSQDFLSSVSNTREQAYKQMSNGLVIVDTVSLVHPRIREAFYDFSLLRVRDSCIILGISPLSPSMYALFGLLGKLETELLKTQLTRAIQEIEESCTYGLNRQHIVHRLLKSALRRQSEHMQVLRPNIEMQTAVRQNINIPTSRFRPVSLG